MTQTLPRPRLLARLAAAAVLLAAVVPAAAQEAGPRLAPDFHAGDPIIFTSYFYWHDADPADPPKTGYTDHPPTWDGFTWRDVGWHETQLADMEYAGIDVVLPVFWGHPRMPDTPENWPYEGLRKLAQAREARLAAGGKPPGVAMFFDTTPLETADPTRPKGQDLTTPEGKDWYYTTIALFFRALPRPHWALLDGKPIVFVFVMEKARAVDETLYPYVRKRFREEFGTELYIVKDREEIPHALLDDPTVRGFADRLRAGTLSYAEVRAALLGTEEFYKVSGGTPEGFIEGLFRAVVDRPPTAEERSAWSARLGDGRTVAGRQAVAFAVLSSRPTRDEAIRLMLADWLKLHLGRPEPLDWLRDHLADPGFPDALPGRLAREIARGLPPSQARLGLLAGPEFADRAGNTPEGFIRRLYETLMARSPSQGDVDAWLKRFAGAPGRAGPRPLADPRTAPVRREIAGTFVETDEAYRVLVATWFIRDLNRMPGWPGYADAIFNFGASVAPNYAGVAGIGPGFDQRGIPSREPHVVSREGGRRYRHGWEVLLAMDPRPSMVHLETWNEFHEGTEICESREYGRTYLDLTRRYAERFHARGR